MEAYLTQLLANSGADRTVNNRIRFLLSVYNLVKQSDKKTPDNSLSFLRNEKVVLARVNDSTHAGTRYGRMVHIMKAIDSVDEPPITKRTRNRYGKLIEELKPQKIEINDNNVMSPAQAQRFMTIPQLNKVVENAIIELFNKYEIQGRSITPADIRRLAAITKPRGLNLFTFAKSFQEIVVMAAYVWQPALRNNWGDLHISTSIKAAAATDRNWMVVNNRAKTIHLIMNQYKNVHAMGQQRIDLTPKITALMFQWFKVLTACLGKLPSFPLLYTFASNGKCEHIESTASIQRQIPRVFEKYTNKPIGINDLRHSHEKSIQASPEYKKMTVNQRSELHRQLLHGFNVAQRYDLLYPEADTKVDVNE